MPNASSATPAPTHSVGEALLNRNRFRILEQAFAAVIKRARDAKIPHRVAAMAIGVERVLAAKKARGLFP